MLIYLRAGGYLRDLLRPDIDCYSKKIEVSEGLAVREIIDAIGIQSELIAFVSTHGNIKRLDYVPRDGEEITLHPPVSGG